MIDQELARTAADSLSTAIASCLEGGLERSAVAPDSIEEYHDRAAALRQMVDDVSVLAAALVVVAKYVQQQQADDLGLPA